MCCGGVHRAAPNSLARHRGHNYGKLQRERGNARRVDAYEPRGLPVSQIIHVVASSWFERWFESSTHTLFTVWSESLSVRETEGWQHRLYKTDKTDVFLWRHRGQECVIQSRILQAGGYDK